MLPSPFILIVIAPRCSPISLFVAGRAPPSVVLRVELPLSKAEHKFRPLGNMPPFDAALQLQYRQAVADLVRVSISVVRIRSVTTTADGVEVETVIEIPSIPAGLNTRNLNEKLVEKGLPYATIVSVTVEVGLPLPGVNRCPLYVTTCRVPAERLTVCVVSEGTFRD